MSVGRWLIRFFRLEAASGLILIAASVVALLIANSLLGDTYRDWLHVTLPRIPLGEWSVQLSVQHFINDALMALFFLVVAAEIKREMLGGQLSNRSALVLPLLCASAGVIVPALIFTSFNHGDAQAMRGWAVPAATDIAFALGMLALLGSRVPLGLKLLLSTIAVLDDLIAIIIIAVFYTDELHSLSLILAVAVMAIMFALNRVKVMNLWVYLLLGSVLWILLLRSGVHATLAGVATGFLLPHVVGDDDDPTPHDNPSPLLRMEHALHPWVAYLILPVFAFANAGLDLSATPLSGITDPIPMGVMLGLLLGKPIGIFGAALLAKALRWSTFPQGVDMHAMFGMSVLCGIGFTMSLFIASLAFGDPLLQSEAVLGVFTASVLSALLGLLWLYVVLPRARVSPSN